MSRTADLLRKHWWWVALVLVIVAGYSLGKDHALRDNVRASVMNSGASR